MVLPTLVSRIRDHWSLAAQRRYLTLMATSLMRPRLEAALQTDRYGAARALVDYTAACSTVLLWLGFDCCSAAVVADVEGDLCLSAPLRPARALRLCCFYHHVLRSLRLLLHLLVDNCFLSSRRY